MTCPKDAQVNWMCKHTHQVIRDGGYKSVVLLSRTYKQTDRVILKRHEDQQQLISTLIDGLDIERREVRLLDFSPSRVTATSQRVLGEHFPGPGSNCELIILVHSNKVFRTPATLDQFMRVIGRRHVLLLLHSVLSEEDWMSLRVLACRNRSDITAWTRGIEPQGGFGKSHSIVCPVVVIRNGGLVEHYESIKKNSPETSAAYARARTAANRRKAGRRETPQSFELHRVYTDTEFRDKRAREMLEAVTGVVFELFLLDDQKKRQPTAICRQDGANSTKCSCSALSGCRLAFDRQCKLRKSLQPLPSFQSWNLQPSSIQPCNLQPSNLQPSSFQPPGLQPSSVQRPLYNPSSYDLSVIRTKLRDICNVTEVEVKGRKQLTDLVTCRILSKLVPFETPQDCDLGKRT